MVLLEAEIRGFVPGGGRLPSRGGEDDDGIPWDWDLQEQTGGCANIRIADPVEF